MVGRIMDVPTDVPIPIPRNCEYITLHNKRELRWKMELRWLIL